MTVLFAVAMALLALAPLAVAASPACTHLERVAPIASALGCVALVVVGLSAALGPTHPTLLLGSYACGEPIL